MPNGKSVARIAPKYMSDDRPHARATKRRSSLASGAWRAFSFRVRAGANVARNAMTRWVAGRQQRSLGATDTRLGLLGNDGRRTERADRTSPGQSGHIVDTVEVKSFKTIPAPSTQSTRVRLCKLDCEGTEVAAREGFAHNGPPTERRLIRLLS
jgi:hypothetical protein